MLKKWFNKVFSTRHHQPAAQIIQHDAKALGLSLSQVNFAAEKVVKRLQQDGFEAYIVGGAVRDLLLGMEPKDFDIATNASPEEVRKLFRRSRIIGRRFRIVHVMVGPETIEVTTFRGGQAHQNADGRIMKDNEYGTQETDALRRDFTCNALYYDPFAQLIIDQHGGIADIAARHLVMIGDPELRYQEDPVRIMRAVRLSAKLGFEIEENTRKPIKDLAHNLQNEPSARLFDEVLKVLLCGYAHQALQQFQSLGLGREVHPYLGMLFEQGIEHPFVRQALANTDDRIRAHKNVSVGFILAATLWPGVYQAWQHYLGQSCKDAHALNLAIANTKDMMESKWGVPHKISAIMREIWQMQVQFDYRRGARAYKTLAQPRFRAAYDFLILRAQVGEVDEELAQWWTEFQRVDSITQENMVQDQNSQNKTQQRTQAKRQLQNEVQVVMEERQPNQHRRRRGPRRRQPNNRNQESQ